jgi:hypothetical protein
MRRDVRRERARNVYGEQGEAAGVQAVNVTG